MTGCTMSQSFINIMDNSNTINLVESNNKMEPLVPFYDKTKEVQEALHSLELNKSFSDEDYENLITLIKELLNSGRVLKTVKAMRHNANLIRQREAKLEAARNLLK